MKAAVAVAAAAFSLTMAAVDVRARLIATTHIPDYYYHSIIDKKNYSVSSTTITQNMSSQ